MLVDTATDDLDGLAVWDWAEGCELPGGTFAIERLGVGHRCETWLVWSVSLWAPAVLKAARPHQIHHPRAVKSLRRETAALAGNLHPALRGSLPTAPRTPSRTSWSSTSTVRR